MLNILEEQLDELKDLLSNSSISKFEIDCINMPKDRKEFILDERDKSYFSELFEKLDKYKETTIYYFEAKNISDANDLVEKLNEYRYLAKENGRVVPAVGKYNDSKVLYVGVRKGGNRKRDNLSNISARIFQHLGYYYKGSTQGLQLCDWSDKIIYLNIITLGPKANEYLYVLEKLLAKNLKPIIGKH
ncbi:hypothetical protein [Algibacter lectus]|uniref:hypothetical protein n=1 Tax=Algibacter lectus TaxID=221126 RepID=UPI0026F17F76|nr:hypothetical protein [Algibacter lectus]MDO7136340.1 hypothetical protein [Algibacter lectus]